jgi:hypothetical protein
MILLIVNAFKLMGSHFKHIQACSGIIQKYIPVDWQLVVRETQLLINKFQVLAVGKKTYEKRPTINFRFPPPIKLTASI